MNTPRTLAWRITSLAVPVLSCLALTPSASALIVDSGNGNTSPPATPAPFPYWDNIGENGNGSAVYLYNGYVLTAGHVNDGVFDIDGDGSGEPTRFVKLLKNPDNSNSDIALRRLEDPDALNDLPAVRVAETEPSAGDPIKMFGTGLIRDDPSKPSAPYNYGDTRDKLWGENRLEAIDADVVVEGLNETNWMTTIFDDPDTVATATPEEARAARFDSGGPAFYFDPAEAQWRLVGLNHAVSGGEDEDLSTVEYGNETVLSNLAPYEDQLPPAPEPASGLMLALGGMLISGRRRGA